MSSDYQKIFLMLKGRLLKILIPEY